MSKQKLNGDEIIHVSVDEFSEVAAAVALGAMIKFVVDELPNEIQGVSTIGVKNSVEKFTEKLRCAIANFTKDHGVEPSK